jgi:lauroyl/myristoyl acyltransferase
VVRTGLVALQRWPPRLAEETLAGVALAHGLLSPRRLRQALAWARSQPGAERPAWLVLSLLAHRGRVFGRRSQIGVRDLPRFRRRVALLGEEHLAAALLQGGTLLLGFHLGAGGESMILRLYGYDVAYAGRAAHQRYVPRKPATRLGLPQMWLWTDETSRVAVLYRVRRHLAAGGIMWMAADGDGREAFHIPLAGRDLTVRSGWFALRRLTRAPTLPVLSHSEGGRLVLEIHPPLPEPVADADVDVAACREILTPLVRHYVQRFPRECFSLALERAAPGR